MKPNSFMLILAFIFATASSSFAYDYSDNLPASQQPPGGLSASQVPMFVSLGWDDNGYSGLSGSGGDGGMTWSTDFQKNLVNPAGTGNSATFDGAAARTTYFMTSYYVANWGSESPVYVKRSWRTAYEDGHEIGNHTENHSDGEPFSVATWDAELSECFSWLTKPFDPTESSPNNTKGIGVPLADLTGFRSPFLHYNNNLFTSIKNQGLTYSASIEDGYWAGYNGTNGYWPHTLNNGSPIHDDLYARGVKSFPVTQHTGVWEMGVPVLMVPDAATAATYGINYDLRVAIQGKWAGFSPSNPLIGGMDYNLWVSAKLTKDEFVAILKYNLDLRLNGNRAPMLLVLHTDEYSPKYTHAPNATPQERQEAVEEFMTYALSKNDVRVAPYDKILNWIKNPVALGNVASSSSSNTSSSSIIPLSSSQLLSSSLAISSSTALSSSLLASSSAQASSCDGIPAWEARVYNWTGVKEYVVYNDILYSHTGWVNSTSPEQNSGWTAEGNCSQTPQSSIGASSSNVSSVMISSSALSSSSTALSSSIELSSSALSSSQLSSSAPLSSSLELSSSVSVSSSSITNTVCDNAPTFEQGQTDANSGEQYVYQGSLWEAQNNPSVWESPSEGWFWTKIASCGSTSTSSSVQLSSSVTSSSSSTTSTGCTGINDWSTITSWVTFAQGDTFTNGTQKATCNAHPAHCFGSAGDGFGNSFWTAVSSCSTSAPRIAFTSEILPMTATYTQGFLNVDGVETFNLTILDIKGKVTFEAELTGKRTNLNLKPGLHFIQIQSGSQRQVLKIQSL